MVKAYEEALRVKSDGIMSLEQRVKDDTVVIGNLGGAVSTLEKRLKVGSGVWGGDWGRERLGRAATLQAGSG